MKRWLLLTLFCLSLPAGAIEFATVETATILYDTPSVRGNKLFVIRRNTPVEVVVKIKDWHKVRDAEGGLAWIEQKYLSSKRTVIVIAERAEIRQQANENSPLVFEAEKNVSLDYLEAALGGWVRVRHHGGQAGFVRLNQIWGF